MKLHRGNTNRPLAALMLFMGMAACNQIGGIDAGALRECLTVNDCVSDDQECRIVVACQDTQCIFKDIPAGTPIESQIVGDCGVIVCAGGDSKALIADATDIPDDGDPCTFDECIGTSPRHTKIKGAEVPCYEGPRESRGVGICAPGLQQCDENGLPVGGCDGQTLPHAETCIYVGDEDCDGESNEEGEACICKPGAIENCYTGPPGTDGVGICRAGTRKCLDDGRSYGPCDDQAPQNEVCDVQNADENCDGQIQEGSACVCGDGLIATSETCDDGNSDDGDACPSSCSHELVAAGEGHTCALLDHVELKCWGWNADGQLGLGDSENRGDQPGEMGAKLKSVNLGTGKIAEAISAGARHTCALLTDGHVKCWGSNAWGALGLGDKMPRGSKKGDLGDYLMTVDLGDQLVTAIAAGDRHTCVITDEFRVKCWGKNSDGQLGLGDTFPRGDEPGEMGSNLLSPLQYGPMFVSAGNDHTCAVLYDNNLVCWGNNAFGQLGQETTTDMGDDAGETNFDGSEFFYASKYVGAKAISAGGRHTCAVVGDDTVHCWGANDAGQLGLGDRKNRGDEPDEMDWNLPAVDLGTGKLAMAIATGQAHSCAILNDGCVKCWGDNSKGQLGLGDTAGRGDQAGELGEALPCVNLGTNKKATSIMAGYWHTCAILSDDTLKCWGFNAQGQLGLGDTNTRGDNPEEMGDNLPTVQIW